MFSLKSQQEARLGRCKKGYEQRLWIEEESQHLDPKIALVSLANRVLGYKKVISPQIGGLFLTLI